VSPVAAVDSPPLGRQELLAFGLGASEPAAVVFAGLPAGVPWRKEATADDRELLLIEQVSLWSLPCSMSPASSSGP
jgi:hypothetical protein